MATKSFKADFKFNTKSGIKLIDAIEKSKRVDYTITQSVKNIRNKESINNIMDSFLQGRNF